MVHHQHGAGGEHCDLQQVAEELDEARDLGVAHAGQRLAVHQAGPERAPAAHQVGQHAHGLNHLGVPQQQIGQAVARLGLLAGLLERLRHRPLIQHRKADHDQGAGEHHGAHQRVQQRAGDNEQRRPGQVEQGQGAPASDGLTNGVQVTQGLPRSGAAGADAGFHLSHKQGG